MNRRTFLLSSIAGVSLIGTASWYAIPAAEKSLSIEPMLDYLRSLRTSEIEFAGKWNAVQTFHHLAQSVEYSMLGYPEAKSQLFQSTLGRIAFHAFSEKKQIRHNLEEPIPGAPMLIAIGNKEEAINRLISALQAFQSYTGKLSPHFAFGNLTHAQYEQAHVMHIQNHFQLLK